MKRIASCLLAVMLLVCLTGCETQTSETTTGIKTIINGSKVYYELGNGKWSYRGNIYDYRLEIQAPAPKSDREITYVYLSNLDEQAFLDVWDPDKLTDNTTSQIDLREAVLVDIQS